MRSALIRQKFTPILLLAIFCLGLQARAQYGNEWIDYSKTYYKIKVGTEGIYRVSLSSLPGSVNGANLILYREGQEVPLYVTTTGAIGSSDYLEFYGQKADGSFDKQLYENPQWQPDDRISMFTDTAVYFLTYDNQSNHLRYAAMPNNIPATPPAALSYCIATVGNYFVKNFSEGRHVVAGQPITLSIFDNGEGYVDTMVSIYAQLNYSINAPNAVSAPANAVINASVLRNTYATINDQLTIFLNNQQIADSVLKPDATQHFNLSVPSSLISATNNFQFSGTANTSTLDDYGVSYIEIQYPRNFDMNSANFFSFQLSASASSQYIEFTNFQNGSTTPRLYDLTNKKWYAADLSVAGKTRFYINASIADRSLVLYSESAVKSVTQLQAFTFKNFTNAANQGDYLIISHPNYDIPVNGHSYLTDYKNYRSSPQGGGRNVIIVNVQDLYDQFGYGIDIHPLSVRNFLRFAYDKWSVKPHDAFFVGKGLLYHKYRTYLQNKSFYPYAAIVPTYGDLGSDEDFVNFLPNRHQAINVGRLSAWNGQEIGAYLDKVKTYEQALKQGPLPTYESELWKKRILHIGGGRDAQQQDYLLTTLRLSADIISDTAFGANVSTVAKSTTNPIDPINDRAIDSLVNDGLSIMSFNGHATSNGFDLALSSPASYNSAPRFPHFIALGCDIAQVFSLTVSTRTLSEQYIMAPSGGSITMIASNNLQYPDFHRQYLPAIYNSIAKVNYGNTIGDHHHYAYDSMRTSDQSDRTYYQIESMLLQGDPAIPVFGLPKPDYHISSNRLSTIPSNVTNTMDSFAVRITAYNLGRALNDTVNVKVEHINPAGTVSVVGNLKMVNLYNTDTGTLNIGVDKVTDVGLNKYRVTIDDNNIFDETNEANNVGTLDVFIYSDKLVPVYPKEFSIVNKPSVTLKASTLNPFREVARYRLEIDTTEGFNSSLKQSTTIVSAGGVIKWTPSISLTDSTVYYWRATFDSAVNGDYQWSYSSFVYLANGTPGWNQSHYYQYLKNSFTDLNYGTDRTFKYPIDYNKLTASNAIYSDQIQGWPWNTADFAKVMLNGVDIQRLGCLPWGGTIQINVFDSLTNLPWKNDSTYGTSGAYPSCIAGSRDLYTFEFPVNTPQGRANAGHFLDSIPNGNFVLVRNIINLGAYDTALVAEWKTDPGQYLYQQFLNFGFTQIDSFNKIRPFIFLRKKGDNSFPVYQYVGSTILDTLEKTFFLPTLRPNGNMNSTVIGPAKQWQQLKWKFSSDAFPQNDRPFVSIYGITPTNNSTLLYKGYAQDTSLSFINASQYPNIKMVWTSYDSISLSSPQLTYWRVLYSPVPEAALNPAAYFTFTDSLEPGEQASFSVAIENLTDLPMDSMLVNYKVIDNNNNSHFVVGKRYRPLPGNDTLHASVVFDPAAYKGNSIFFVEANPDNDQPEQYHPNNLGYLPFKVNTDMRNPFLDVTFDGVHILDRDIVSAKPFIKIVLKDDSKYLRLDDTSLLKVSLRYPDEVSASHVIPFDGSICKFIPAQDNGKNNEAVIEFRPTFLEDGTYQLYVNGRDKSGNEAGQTDYTVAFEVVNKSTITNVLNYPNPFSTATAFVFTITGSQIPSQFKIQIMTVTGKVVREITKPELGPIHIGRNVTEYKWDGRDQYGQLLGNGVYLYRVVTSINGNGIEHRSDMDLKDNGDNVDKFFKNGYGKMYIMR
jgi:flagellar hook assembly protein FlgD